MKKNRQLRAVTACLNDGPFLLLLRNSTLVDQIGDAHVGHTGIGLKAYLTSTTVGITVFHSECLNLGLQLAQCVFVDFGEGEATVAGKTATAYAFGNQDVVGAHLGKGYELITEAHLTGGTSDVDGYLAVDGMELETVLEEGHDELYGFVEFHLGHHLTHTVEARALVTENGIFALLGSYPKGFFQFGTLAVGNVEHSL